MKKLSLADFSKALIQLGCNEEKIEALYELSQGSLNTALKFTGDEQLELYQQVKNALLSATPKLPDIHKLCSLVLQEGNWEIFKYSVQKVMHDWLASADIKLKKKVLDKIDQFNLRLSNCENQHLDKQQTILAILL